MEAFQCGVRGQHAVNHVMVDRLYEPGNVTHQPQRIVVQCAADHQKKRKPVTLNHVVS